MHAMKGVQNWVKGCCLQQIRRQASQPNDKPDNMQWIQCKTGSEGAVVDSDEDKHASQKMTHKPDKCT